MVNPNYLISNTLGLRAESAYGRDIQSITYRPSTPLTSLKRQRPHRRLQSCMHCGALAGHASPKKLYLHSWSRDTGWHQQ